MKTLLSNASLLICTLLISLNINAQDFQGKAYYFSKTTVDMDNWGGREMSPDMKARIAERMKSMFEKTYVLTFNRTESIYKEEEVLEAPGRGGGFNFMASFSGGDHYKNVKDGQVLQEQEFFGKQFLVKDELPKLEWKMETETKQIGQYTCFKATAMKTVAVESLAFSLFSSLFRRRILRQSNSSTDIRIDADIWCMTGRLPPWKPVSKTAAGCGPSPCMAKYVVCVVIPRR